MLLGNPLVITPKTPTLNPNADVFHSLSPLPAMPPDYPSTSSCASSWTTEPVQLQPPSPSITSLPGNPNLAVNGGDLAAGGVVQMVVVYPPLSTPSSPICSEYASTVDGCQIPEAAQALFPSGADTRTANDEMGPLEDFMEPGELRIMLKRQLEYYFSRENLASDTYLVSQMDADQFVPITTVANFNQVKRLTRNIDLVIEVLRESGNVQVDETGEKVRPLHKRCIVILREIPDSTPIEEVEKLFASDSCPTFISCQFAHNNSWYVTFDTEEDAQRAYRYLREEVKTFLGMPIMARIKAKPLLRSSYLTKEANSDYSPNIYQQPKFSYTSPVPSIQYIPPQNLPFFTPHASLSPVWSASVVYYDPGMAFAANGYVPTATYTPPPANPSQPSAQQCSTVGPELQSPRSRGMRARFCGRGGSLDHGDMGDHDYPYRRSWQQPTTRVADDEYHSSYDLKRPPRYSGVGGPQRTQGPRSEFFRGGMTHKAPPMSPRTGVDHRCSGGRRPMGVGRSSCSSDNEVFHYGSPGAASVVAGTQGSQTLGPRPEGAAGGQAEAGGSSSEATAVQGGRDMALPPRSGGGYKSRRRSRPSLCETAKNSGPGSQPSVAAAFELQEKSFPPLPGFVKSSAPQNDKFETRISDVVRGTVATVEATKSNHEPLNGTMLSVAAAVRVSFADVPTSTAAAASSCSDKESVSAAGSAVDACPVLTPQESPQRHEKSDGGVEKFVVPEVTGTPASGSAPISTSVCSFSLISNQPSSELPASKDESCQSSQKLSYAEMALRGKERQGARTSLKPGANDTQSPSAAAATPHLEATVSPSVHRAEPRDPLVRNSKHGAVQRQAEWPENGCRSLLSHEARKCEAV